MKRSIYISVVSIIFVALFNSCKEEQWYSNEEIQAMREYTKLLSKYLSIDSVGNTMLIEFVNDTAIYMNKEKIKDTFVIEKFANANFMGIEGNIGHKPRNELIGYIICGKWHNVMNKEYFTYSSNVYTVENIKKCSTAFYFEAYVSINQNQPYIERFRCGVEVSNDTNSYYESINQNNAIFPKEFSDTLVLTRDDNSDFKMVFKKNIGLVYVSDTAHHTWTLVK